MKPLLPFLPAILIASLAQGQYAPPDPSGFEGLIVERYYVADANDAADTDGGEGLTPGAVTYRVFADLKQGYQLISVGGFTNHPLTISSSTSFFNNDDRGESWGRDIPAQHLNKNTVAIDTWLTAGAASTLHWGVPKADDTDGSVVGGVNNNGGSGSVPGGLLVNSTPEMGAALTVADGLLLAGTPPGIVFVGTAPDFLESGGGNSYSNDNFAWGVLGNIASPDTANRILLGQFTTDGELDLCFNLWVRIPDSLVCADPNCHQIMEFYSEIVPADTLGGGFSTENKFSHPTLCFNSSTAVVDCNGVPGGTALPGSPCDDGNDDTTNDVLLANCTCAGEDCLGVLGGSALPGQPCDDGDPDTAEDIWQTGCICAGTVGIAERDPEGLPFTVHPNPTNDLLWIDLRNVVEARAVLNLFDALGKSVLTLDLGSVGGNTIPVDMSTVQPGSYVLQLVIDGNSHVRNVVRL